MIRKITEQHLREANKKPVYKVVKVEGDGRLMSLIAGDLVNECEAHALTYKENRVVSDGKFGIWCNLSLKYALIQVNKNGRYKRCRIYKVYPIGKPIKPPRNWGDCGTVLYPAIIMGKRRIKTIDDRRC